MIRTKMMTLVIRTLFVVGLHPHKLNKLNYAWAAFAIVCAFLLCISVMMEVFIHWTSVDSLGKADIIPMYFKGMVSLIMYLQTHQRISTLITKVNTLDLDIVFSDKISAKMDRVTTLAYKTMTNLILLTVFTLSCYFASALYERKLALEMYQICDLKGNLCYFGLIVFQAYCSFFAVSFIVGYDCIYVHVVSNVYFKLLVIEEVIRNLDLDREAKCYEVVLGKVIRFHADVLSLASEMREVYSSILLLHYSVNMFPICLGFYLMLMDGVPSLERFLQYFTMISAVSSEFAIYCLWGTVLIDQSTKIADAAYNSNWWTRTHPDTRKTMSLVIARSQKAAVITIGEVSILNLEKYVDIMKNAMSFFTLMKNIKEK